ncbi:hypothetical protein Emed_005704 [Eimeria media]
MGVEEVKFLESSEAWTSSSARSGPMDHIDDVMDVERGINGNIQIKRSTSSYQTRRVILTAFLSLAVALSIAFLLQKCFYGIRLDVATEPPGLALTRRGKARRLAAGNPGGCFSETFKTSGATSGRQTAAKDDEHEGDTQTAGGYPHASQAAGQHMEGTGSSEREAEALGSPSSSRTAQGDRGSNILIRGLRRAMNATLRFFRGFRGSEQEDPIPRDEIVLMSIRKKGSTGGFPDDSNDRNIQQEAGARAPSVSDSSAENNEESDDEEEKAHRMDEERGSTSSEEGEDAAEGGEAGSTMLEQEEQLIAPDEPLSAFLAKGHSPGYVKIAKIRRKMAMMRMVDLEAEHVERLVQEAWRLGPHFFNRWILEYDDDDVFD